MSDKTCTTCKGEQGFEGEDHSDEPTRWYACPDCGGTGEAEPAAPTVTSDSAARGFAHKTNGVDGWSAEDAYERGWRDSLAAAPTVGPWFWCERVEECATCVRGSCIGPHRTLLLGPEVTA
jgi:hypothetical protein